MSSGPLQEVKNNGKSLTVRPQKVVMVAYRRWLFTRGYHCKALAGEILVFWIGGHLWEVVAYGSLTVFGNILLLDVPESFLFPFLSGQSIRGAL